MIIEFIGVPASGKTTVARNLVNELNKTGYPADLQFPIENNRKSRISRLFKKTLLCCRTGITDLNYTLRLSKLLFSIDNLGALRLINLLLNGLYIKGLNDDAQRSTLNTVFHQGFIQYIYSLGKVADETIFDDIAKKMLPWMPHIDQVVLVKAESNLVEARLAARSESERRKMGHIKSLSEIEMSERLMKKLYSHLTNYSLNVSTVESNESTPTLLEILPQFPSIENLTRTQYK